MKSEKRFKAVLERGGAKGLGWVIARVPKWEVGGRARIRGEINGFAFRTSLFSASDGGRFILVNKKMQAGAGARLGDTAEFRIELDEEEREVVLPPELVRLFRGEKALKKFYEELNESARGDVGTWVNGVKSAEARQRRAEQL